MDELYCRHFLICQTVWYDADKPESGHSLGRILVHVRPSDGKGYPVRFDRLFAYIQLYGAVSDHTISVRLVQVEPDADEPTEAEVAVFGPWDVAVTGLELVECVILALDKVPVSEPGLYEFQLWADGFDDSLARERIDALE